MNQRQPSLRNGLASGLLLALSLSGCAVATNRSLESIHQPVVSRSNYTLDLVTGPGGLSTPEQSRLAGWFEAMNLRYGDRISIDDPLASSATRAAVETVAARFGLIVGDDAPVTSGVINAGTARVILSRSTASVPGCTDWKTRSDTNMLNGTSSNYGCATNSNLAAMVADPEHLLHGASGPSGSSATPGNKAIETYTAAKPTGAGGLKENSTKGGN